MCDYNLEGGFDTVKTSLLWQCQKLSDTRYADPKLMSDLIDWETAHLLFDWLKLVF